MKSNHEELNNLAVAMDELAAEGLNAAEKIGADETKLSTSCSFQRKLVVENKEFSLANSIETQNFRVIVHKDQKKGSASINTDNKDALCKAVKDAADLASFSVRDEVLNFPDTKTAKKAEQLDFMYHDDAAEYSLDELQENMKEVLATLTENPKIAIDRFEMSQDVSRHALFNSHGVAQSEIQTMINWTWMGMAVDGDEVTGFDYDYNFSFERGNYIEKVKEDAKAFCDRLIGFLKPTKCPSYKGAVLLSPRAVSSILTNTILFHASGRAVMDGKSKWADDIGNKIVSDKFSISDNPHGNHFSGATSFDGDGIPTVSQELVTNGVLNLHLHDCYSAKKVGSQSTATSGGPFGLSVKGGTSSLEKMRGATKNLLVVDRFAGNCDPIKGDFSGVAKSSRLYQDGKDCGAVTETMIAGNFFEIADKLLEVSKETDLISGSFSSPWILVDGISVTGN